MERRSHLRPVNKRFDPDDTIDYAPGEFDRVVNGTEEREKDEPILDLTEDPDKTLDSIGTPTSGETSPFFIDVTTHDLPFEAVRNLLANTLVRINSFSTDQKILLQELDQAKQHKDFEKIKVISLRLNTLDKELAIAERTIQSLVDPQYIDETIGELKAYKEAYYQHLLKINDIINEGNTPTMRDLANLRKYQDNNRGELAVVEELIKFCEERRDQAIKKEAA